jgi:hypothetical protein
MAKKGLLHETIYPGSRSVPPATRAAKERPKCLPKGAMLHETIHPGTRSHVPGSTRSQTSLAAVKPPAESSKKIDGGRHTIYGTYTFR